MCIIFSPAGAIVARCGLSQGSRSGPNDPEPSVATAVTQEGVEWRPWSPEAAAELLPAATGDDGEGLTPRTGLVET